jgi:hypothetical protein
MAAVKQEWERVMQEWRAISAVATLVPGVEPAQASSGVFARCGSCGRRRRQA